MHSPLRLLYAGHFARKCFLFCLIEEHSGRKKKSESSMISLSRELFEAAYPISIIHNFECAASFRARALYLDTGEAFDCLLQKR